MPTPATLTMPSPRRSASRLERGRVFRAAAHSALIAAAFVTVSWMPAPAAQSPSRAPAARAAGADRASVEAARRFLCPHGGTPVRGGRCRAGGGAFASTAALGRDASVRDWDAGLPTAARRQAPCPEGTVNARVLFWDDAVRCLPK